eukprot:scaffold19025_cov20-Tisochrysis_lutea.AAC.1
MSPCAVHSSTYAMALFMELCSFMVIHGVHNFYGFHGVSWLPMAQHGIRPTHGRDVFRYRAFALVVPPSHLSFLHPTCRSSIALALVPLLPTLQDQSADRGFPADPSPSNPATSPSYPALPAHLRLQPHLHASDRWLSPHVSSQLDLKSSSPQLTAASSGALAPQNR